jgi:hypothetical protein
LAGRTDRRRHPTSDAHICDTKTLATTGMRASARPGNQPCARTATPRRVGAGWKLDHLRRLKTGPPDRPGVRGAWGRLRRARTRFVGAAHGRMQWNALNATAVCSSSSAHRRFQEWTVAGVFAQFWRQGLLAYDELKGIDWTWLALDGAMGKAPLGGPETGPNPTDRAKRGRRSPFSVTPQGSRSGSPPRAPTATTKRS